MNLKQGLKWLTLGGLFALLFTPFLVTISLFFPFITGKAFFFRVIVEVIFGAWLILTLIDPQYRPRRSPLLWAISIFIAIISLATIFSEDPARSFWSNYERMEGLITHFHLFAYFLVASSTLAVSDLWRRFFQTSLGISVAIALYGLLQLFGFLTINQGGVRLDATFGNATYLAIYIVFHLFLAAWLFLSSSGKWPKTIYAASAALELIILYYTATRGAILGLLAGLALAAAVFAWRERGRLRKISIGIVASLVILAGLFFLVKDIPAIRNHPVLGRFASISLTERTTQSRFIIWQMGWQGFKEQPLLGWGLENYNLVFNKYYDPRLWQQEQWFDRSHNIIFDWLIAAGLLGLLSYLSIFAVAGWLLWRSTKKLIEKSLFSGLLAAYFFHNLFVFDNLISYLLFFTILSFLAVDPLTKKEDKLLGGKKNLAPGGKTILGIIVVLATAGVVYGANVKPYLANRELIRAMTPGSMATAEAAAELANDRLVHFQRSINYRTFGRSEAREQLTQWAFSIVSSPVPPDGIKQTVAKYAFQELVNQTKETPRDARHQLFAGLFLSRVGETDAAVGYLKRALELSPKKQTIMMELAKVYAAKSDYLAAVAVAKIAFELDSNHAAARNLYAAMLIYSGDLKAADRLLEDGFGTVIVNDDALINAYADTGLYSRVQKIWELKTRTDPNSLQNWVSLAAAYLSVGERGQSINALEKAIEINPGFKAEGEYYISEIRAGRNP